MTTRRRAARQIMAEMKTAYQALNEAKPHGDDWDKVSQSAGYYEGLRRAYTVLTGQSAQDVAHEVVHWYIGTDSYQASKEQKP